MAKGFGTGLIHGGLASAAALLALALVVPLPEGVPVQPEAAVEALVPEEPVESTPAAEAPQPDAEPEPTAPEPSAPPAALQRGESSVDSPADAAPQAGSVTLPVGSEFARSADLAPPVPAIPEAPAASASLTEAPAVVAPAAEPAPVSSAAPVQLPDPTTDSGSVSRLTTPEAEAAPDLSGILAGEAPALAAAPAGLAEAAAPDELPAAAAPLPEVAAETPRDEPAPEAQAEPVVEPEPEAVPEVVTVEPEPAPEPAAEPAPAAPSGLDLSTPPDLTDLNLLERN